MDGNVAYLQVFVFNENVDSQFKKAASEIAHSNATRIVLDLRDNPGGLLDSSITLAGYFLDPEKIVTIERFGNGVENNYKTEANGQLKQYPLVILINKGSASASEILAGALRDQRHSAIIGETSYGKGSVNKSSDLANGSSLKVTVAKWFTPSGLSINENGIKPNVDIQLTEDDIKNDLDPQLKKRSSLSNHYEPRMKVLFLQNIKGVAQIGDIKNISDGYARNFCSRANLQRSRQVMQ